LESITWILELTRFISLLLVMGYAAYRDYRTGEVSNKLWRYALLGGFITALETTMFFSVALFLVNLSVILVCVGWGFLMFKLGGGGADSKALMVIAVSAPLFPLWSFLWPLPLPVVAMLVASVLALPALVFKRSNESFMKRKIRFLPFMFVGLLFCVIL
jgi:Flp pilus assembly protein protease CpaA